MKANKTEFTLLLDTLGLSNVFNIVQDYEITNPLEHPSEWEEQFSNNCDTSFANAWDEYFTSSEWNNSVTP